MQSWWLGMQAIVDRMDTVLEQVIGMIGCSRR